jgi:hypothetical protein
MLLAGTWAVPPAVTRPVRHGCEPPAWCGVDFSELGLEDADGMAPPFRASPSGHRQDALHLLRAHGANVFRMRLWNEPCADGRCDPAKFAYANRTNVLRMARRVRTANLSFVLDLHYSDWWADPHNQRKPMAWKGLSAVALREAVFSWTRDAVAAFVAQGTAPLAVQVRSCLNMLACRCAGCACYADVQASSASDRGTHHLALVGRRRKSSSNRGARGAPLAVQVSCYCNGSVRRFPLPPPSPWGRSTVGSLGEAEGKQHSWRRGRPRWLCRCASKNSTGGRE